MSMKSKLKTRGVLAGCVLIALAAIVSGCSSSGSSPSSGKSPVIAVTVNNASGAYPAAMIDRTKQLCQQKGWTCNILDPNLNATTQSSQLQTAITNGVSAVLYFPVNVDTATPILQKMKDANIPVVNWGNRVRASDSNLVATFAGEDSIFEGSAMGKQVCTDAAGKSVQVAVVTGLPASNATTQRTQGFKDAIAACPNVTIKASEPADFDQAKALTVTTDMLQANPGVSVVYAEDDIMGLGAIQAIKSAGKTGQISVYGIGGAKQFVDQIVAGNAVATIGQDPWAYADSGVQAVADTLAGKTLPPFIQIDLPVVTKANASTYTPHW